MKKIISTLFVTTFLMNCDSGKTENKDMDHEELKTSMPVSPIKPLNPKLPTIGLLMFNGVLQSEVVATSDVFAKPSDEGKQLFNVITIAENENPIVTEEGLRLIPDYTFSNCPNLNVLFVPSAYDMNAQIKNNNIIEFIRQKNKETQYMVSNCAGAQLIGKSNIAAEHKIVTWIGGGKQLQEDYPNLKVQNDSLVSFVKDGKFLSSNGNLASYISALELLEIMTNKKHRVFIESYLYLDQLKAWDN